MGWLCLWLKKKTNCYDFKSNMRWQPILGVNVLPKCEKCLDFGLEPRTYRSQDLNSAISYMGPMHPIPTDNSSSSFLSKYIISKIKIDIWWYKRNVAIWGKLPMLLIWRGKTVYIRIISSLKVPVLERLMNLTWNKSTNTYVFIHLFMNWFSFVFLQSVAVNWSNHWMMKESWIVIVPMHARKSSIP